MLNWVTEGNPVIVLHQFQQPLQIGHWSFPETLAITDNGIRSALLFVSRVGISVSIAVLLTLTTAWQKLLRSLRVLGVPQFFVFTLGMTYRYIHLLLSVLLDIHLGKTSRTLRARLRSKNGSLPVWAIYLSAHIIWERAFMPRCFLEVFRVRLRYWKSYNGVPLMLLRLPSALLSVSAC